MSRNLKLRPTKFLGGFLKLAIVSLLIILLLSFACRLVTPTKNSSSEGLELVEEAWQIIWQDFVDKEALKSERLSEGAIRGLVEALDDPYTSYLNAEQFELSKTRLKGRFSGIGATVTIKERQLMVVAPIAGSPAEEAGIRSGDKILEINGEPTSEMSLIEATLKIRGKEGTKVKLLVLHRGEDIPIEIEVIRAEIDLPSVDWEMLPENIAHLGITNFSGRTDYEFASALEDIESQGATAIVLDLRDNPGGMLNAAVSVASQFLEEGLVLYTVDSEGERTNWEVKPEGLALDTPLAVLVNGGSASASEVVAGALQDNQRGPIIGVKTLGKGSVNRVHQLSNGGALYITYARWFTPSGGQIDEEGIIPDIEVEMTAEDVENDRDPQLEQAIEYLTQRR